MVEQGRNSGAIEPRKYEIIRNAFDFAERTARQAMVPRTHVFAVNKTSPVEKIIEKILENPPEYVSTAKVFDMLLAVPKFGRVKAARFLNQCRISQSKTVGGLSDRQRAELIGLLNR